MKIKHCLVAIVILIVIVLMAGCADEKGSDSQAPSTNKDVTDTDTQNETADIAGSDAAGNTDTELNTNSGHDGETSSDSATHSETVADSEGAFTPPASSYSPPEIVVDILIGGGHTLYARIGETKSWSIDLSNTGETPLKLSSFHLDGNETCAFQVQGTNKSVLLKNQVEHITIGFSSEVTGTFNVALSVASNADNDPTLIVPLCATVVTDEEYETIVSGSHSNSNAEYNSKSKPNSGSDSDTDSDSDSGVAAPSEFACEPPPASQGACGGGDGSRVFEYPTCDDTSPSLDVSGRWTSGYEYYDDGDGPYVGTVVYELVQNGSAVSGTYQVDDGTEGILTGVVSGTTGCGQGAHTTSSCPGVFEFTAFLSEDRIEARLIGVDCSGPFDENRIWIGSRLDGDEEEEREYKDGAAACEDNTDNDGDGLVDCDDPDCGSFSYCNKEYKDGAAACEDSADNDGDGLVDCADPDCSSYSPCNREDWNGAAACEDMADNDRDGLFDCNDPDCSFYSYCNQAE